MPEKDPNLHDRADLKASNIILGCRNVQKGEAAKRAIFELSPRTTVEVWKVDLSNFSSVLAFGHRLKTLPRLDGFVANAGLETVTFERTEGYENMLTVNVISTVLLAVLALPKLQETAVGVGKHTNLVIVGSMQHVFAPFEELRIPPREHILEHLSNEQTARMQGRYELTKLMVQLCEKDIAEKLANNGQNQVVVNCVNPGWCATDLSRYYDKGKVVGTIFKMIGRTSEAGSRCLVHAVTAGMETHGQYLSECLVKVEGDFVRSEEGERIRKRLFKEVSDKIEYLAPGAMAVLV